MSFDDHNSDNLFWGPDIITMMLMQSCSLGLQDSLYRPKESNFEYYFHDTGDAGSIFQGGDRPNEVVPVSYIVGPYSEEMSEDAYSTQLRLFVHVVYSVTS